MKVVAFNGSPRKKGNTTKLIQTVFKELEEQGIETELIQLSGRNLRGCNDCGSCTVSQEPKCVIKEDTFNDCLAKLISADGIILGSPVFSAGVTSQMKALLERAGIVLKGRGLLRHKVGAAVSAARRAGSMATIDTMHHFMMNKEMFIVGSTYWNMVYGLEIGEVEHDEEGMANMKNIGQNMAWLLKKIHGIS